MKIKFLCFWLLLIMLVLNFALDVCASEIYDSVKHSDEILSKILNDEEQNEYVVKLYGAGSQVYGVGEGESISELIEWCEEEKSIKYVVAESKNATTVKLRRIDDDGTVYSLPRDAGSPWDEMTQYALSPERVFGNETEVYNVYCFDGFPGHAPSFIYYETDKGGYALLKEYFAPNDLCLMPEESFVKYAKAYYDYVRQLNSGDEFLFLGAPDLPEEDFDMSPYLFVPLNVDDKDKSNDIAPIAVTVAVVTVVSVFAVLIVSKMAKKRNAG